MKKRFVYLALSFVVILTLSTACSALSLVNPPPADQADDSGSDSDDDAGNGSDEDTTSGSDEDQDAGDEGEVLTCFHVTNYTLTFDHTLTVNEEGTSLTHILKQGSIALQAEDDPGKYDTLISTVAAMPLNFEYLGVLGPCSVEAGGTVIVSAEGFCDAGIVYLSITENWSETEGTMTCDDAPVPFSAPGQSNTHTGASGMGEEFLVTNDSSGHTLMREVLGGEGYHSWTLKADDFSVVPLIDPD
jgi:hypothetical protein